MRGQTIHKEVPEMPVFIKCPSHPAFIISQPTFFVFFVECSTDTSQESTRTSLYMGVHQRQKRTEGGVGLFMSRPVSQ